MAGQLLCPQSNWNLFDENRQKGHGSNRESLHSVQKCHHKRLHVTPAARWESLLHFDSAMETGEPNRIVTVSAWPLKVLCLKGESGELKAEIDRLLSIISREPSPVRRSDALNYMLGAIVSGPEEYFLEVFAHFKNACLEPLKGGKRNKRGESTLATFIPILAHVDHQLASESIEQINGPTLREQAKQNIEKYKELRVDEICVWPNIA